MKSKSFINNAVILLGGSGVRLRPFSLFYPKCMHIFRNRKIIDEVIDCVFGSGVKDIYLSINYKSESQLKSHLEKRNFDYFDNKLLIEDFPSGTAGWMKWAKKFKDTFLVLNGDDLLDIDLMDVYKQHKDSNAMITIIVTDKKDITNSGSVELEKKGCDFCKIKSFEEKPKKKQEGLASTGWYLVEPDIFDLVRDMNKDSVGFETDIFPELCKYGKIYGYHTKQGWFPLGNYSEINEAVKNWRKTQ